MSVIAVKRENRKLNKEFIGQSKINVRTLAIAAMLSAISFIMVYIDPIYKRLLPVLKGTR